MKLINEILDHNLSLFDGATRGKSRWPSACRRCFWACLATTPMPITPEANRAFWRQSVLPMVNRTLGSMAHWLAPSFGEGFRLEPDLDRIEALSTERAVLWARVDAATFLDRKIVGA